MALLRAFLLAGVAAVLAAPVSANTEPQVGASTCEATQGSALLQRGAPRLAPKAPGEAPQTALVRHSLKDGVEYFHGRKLSKATFAVFTRAIAEEIPFLEAFVRHYLSIGVQHFYVLSNRQEDLRQVAQYLPGRNISGAHYTFLLSEGPADDVLLADDWLSYMSEDYVVTVDVDEYWVLPDGLSTLQELATDRPADVWMGKWSWIVNDDLRYDLQPPYSAIDLGSGGKYIAKREKLLNFYGIHTPVLKPGEYQSTTMRTDGGLIAHFWGRSFLDATTKGITQLFRDENTPFNVANDSSGFYHGCEGLSQTLKLIDQGELPERLKLLAQYTSVAKHFPDRATLVNVSHPLLTVDREREDEALMKELGEKGIMNSVLEKLNQTYTAFKQCIQPEIAALEPDADLRPQPDRKSVV